MACGQMMYYLKRRRSSQKRSVIEALKLHYFSSPHKAIGAEWFRPRVESYPGGFYTWVLWLSPRPISLLWPSRPILFLLLAYKHESALPVIVRKEREGGLGYTHSPQIEIFSVA